MPLEARLSADPNTRRQEYEEVHYNVSHPRFEGFWKHLRPLGAETTDKGVVEKICADCPYCAVSGRVPGRPHATLPRSLKKNRCVAMVHFYLPRARGVGLCMVNCGTQFLRSAWQVAKKPQETCDNVMDVWILEGGASGYALMDAARELHAQELYNMFKRFPIVPLGEPTDGSGETSRNA